MPLQLPSNLIQAESHYSFAFSLKKSRLITSITLIVYEAPPVASEERLTDEQFRF